jgi:hypothetical protein
MAKECKIQCKVRKGLFEKEMIARIEIVDSNGNDVEAECWAYPDNIDSQHIPTTSDEIEAFLHAYSLGSKEGFVAVVLPQSTFQNGPNVIVREEKIFS